MDFVFVPDSDAGVTGVVSVPARTNILRYRPRVRIAVVIFCVALGVVFAALFPQLAAPHVRFAPVDEFAASAAASLASFLCAFLLSSRLAISRSPALAALAATFMYSGILLGAHAWLGHAAGDWLWTTCALGGAVGIAMFGAIDWYWARKQRRSADRGYYSDTRQRFKRLKLPKAMAVLFWANGIAIALATVIVLSALRFAAMGQGESAVWAAWSVGAYGVAAALLIFTPGHRTILRDWMIAAVAAGALSAAAIDAASSGGSEATLIATAYALIAALIPAAVLLFDAKIDMYVVDSQAQEIHELALVNDLTGLGTARAFRIHLERAIALADATRVGFDVALFDVAGLRAANRNAGGNVGNGLLVLTSRVISSALQPGEFAARCKGDEFAALLIPCDADVLNLLRARVAKALDALGPRPERVDLGLHVGVHRYDPLAPQSPEAFMRAGWQRLFAEKASVDAMRQS